MAHYPKRMLAASIAIAVSLTACGGGGGGSGLVSTPPPPPSPTPTPPPQMSGAPGVITAPAAATVAAGMSPVLASPGGSNFTSGPAAGTVFPLLQTTLVVDGDSIDADPEANASGGTATMQGGRLTIDLRHTHAGLAGTHGFSGGPDDSGYSSLDWTRVGYWSTGGQWDYHEAPLRHSGVFVAGYETLVSAMPMTGSATYTGRAMGAVYFPVNQGSGQLLCNCAFTFVAGDASFTANFGDRSLTGSLTNMWAGGDPWNDDPNGGPWSNVTFSSSIIGSRFSGTTLVTSTNVGVYSLAGNATGTVEGRFFGPSAQEAGAVWTLSDGVKSAIGTLTGKRP